MRLYTNIGADIEGLVRVFNRTEAYELYKQYKISCLSLKKSSTIPSFNKFLAKMTILSESDDCYLGSYIDSSLGKTVKIKVRIDDISTKNVIWWGIIS